MEPCHTAGRTQPCTDALIRAGVKRVIAAAKDPNMGGKGFTILRKAGLQVDIGVLKEEATELNRAFFKWITRKIPYVTLKLGITLDGKIADFQGTSKWITNEKARKEAHRLRAQADAVMVGARTAVQDNPSLQPHLIRSKKSVLPVFVDPLLRTAALGGRREAQRPLIYCGGGASVSRRKALEEGADIVECPKGYGGLDLPYILKDLGAREVLHLLVEGGGRLAGSFLEQGLVDEAVIYLAPMVLGDPKAVPAFSGALRRSLQEAIGGELIRTRTIGGNAELVIRFTKLDNV